jgi:N-acyl amino acid synthase of PEP-CTERM/exosortase system
VGGVTDESIAAQIGDLAKRDNSRRAPFLSLGLIASLVQMSRETGMTTWFGVMEPALLRLLSRSGIRFNSVGPTVEFHGRRQPCVQGIQALLDGVKAKRPDVWEMLTSEI